MCVSHMEEEIRWSLWRSFESDLDVPEEGNLSALEKREQFLLLFIASLLHLSTEPSLQTQSCTLNVHFGVDFLPSFLLLSFFFFLCAHVYTNMYAGANMYVHVCMRVFMCMYMCVCERQEANIGCLSPLFSTLFWNKNSHYASNSC